MFWRDTVMSKVLPSVVTASAIAWVTSSRLKRGERKGKELLCVREIFHSVLKSMRVTDAMTHTWVQTVGLGMMQAITFRSEIYVNIDLMRCGQGV